MQLQIRRRCHGAGLRPLPSQTQLCHVSGLGYSQAGGPENQHRKHVCRVLLDWKTSECFTTVAAHNQHEHRQLERGEKRESSEKSLPRISIIRIIAACVQVIHDEKSHATDAYLTLHLICLAE